MHLVLQNLTAAVQLVDSVQSSTVDTLFNLFDQNRNGTIELCEVSWGLHKLKPQMPQEDARQQALQHFLLFDQGEQRFAPLSMQGLSVFLSDPNDKTTRKFVVACITVASMIISHALCCRHLDKQDFTVFLQRYCLLSDTKLSEIADDMIAKLSQPDRPSDSAATSDDAMQLQMQAVSTHQVRFLASLRLISSLYALQISIALPLCIHAL